MLFQVAVAIGPASTPLVTAALFAPVHGLIQPASANSDVQLTSMPMMSIPLSLAASRLYA